MELAEDGGLDDGILDDGILDKRLDDRILDDRGLDDRRVDVGRLDDEILILDKGGLDDEVGGLEEEDKEVVVFRILLVGEDELVKLLVPEARVSATRMLLRLII
ncbi:hypothetical protein BDZ45DRAFT_450962 [Acephala macrosclerotiorum]|nr:hypothetical protein BDZ45DRAFT_450962 [Acephala macrosclerotiorum]